MVYAKSFKFGASSIVCFTCVEILVLLWWSLVVLRMIDDDVGSDVKIIIEEEEAE